MPMRTVAWLYECANASIKRTVPWLMLSELLGDQIRPCASGTLTGVSSTQLDKDQRSGEASASR